MKGFLWAWALSAVFAFSPEVDWPLRIIASLVFLVASGTGFALLLGKVSTWTQAR